jgi:hypothetical protein
MHLLLLLLYTALPVALACLAWEAKRFYNIIDWDGHTAHDVYCGCNDLAVCRVSIDIRARDPRFRVELATRTLVLLVGLFVMGEMWTWLADWAGA